MSGITLGAALIGQINTAMADGKPMLVAYVDGHGQPKISYRGSVQVYGPDQLAIWVRDPKGGLLDAMSSENPRITLFYRDPESRTQHSFYGRGWIADDDETRQRVFAASDEREQSRDPEMKGSAVIVDLDLVQGGGPEGRFEQRR